MSEQPATEPVSEQQTDVTATPSVVPVCGDCGRERTIADDYDYTPMQVFTGRKLGWFNGDGEQMCGECLTATMRGERP
jgi:hypothetical protein